MKRDFTLDEKLRTVEFFVEQWRVARSQGTDEEREVYLILKSVAKDIRARQRAAEGASALSKLQRHIDKANASKTNQPGAGYLGRTLFALAEALISEWPTVRQALEQFERENPQ